MASDLRASSAQTACQRHLPRPPRPGWHGGRSGVESSPLRARAELGQSWEEPDWCAWQESNLLPHAPQACALSGELQAHKPTRSPPRGASSDAFYPARTPGRTRSASRYHPHRGARPDAHRCSRAMISGGQRHPKLSPFSAAFLTPRFLLEEGGVDAGRPQRLASSRAPGSEEPNHGPGLRLASQPRMCFPHRGRPAVRGPKLPTLQHCGAQAQQRLRIGARGIGMNKHRYIGETFRTIGRRRGHGGRARRWTRFWRWAGQRHAWGKW
jgi:hypothetical protein